MHNGLVTLKGQKMAKSIGNVFTLSQALKRYSPEAIRYFLLSAHYRSPLEYNENSLEEAASSLERIYTLLKRIRELRERPKKDISLELQREKGELSRYLNEMEEKFTCAMDDDFNTSLALSIIFEGVKKANLLLEKEELLDNSSYQLLLDLEKKIRSMGRILGLFQKEDKKLGEREEKLVQLLVKVRNKLREKKDWPLADEIRKGLSKLGIELEDKRDRTIYRLA
jgi:cysteinyl-tRNA synthetase